MGNLLYLAGVIVVSVVISVVIVLRNRKPTSMEAGIEAFSKELRALAPDKRPIGAPAPRPRARDDKRSGATSG
jgi:hypothetical protein